VKSLSEVLVRPIVTEKTTGMGEVANKYVFEVARASNKHEIKRAVEQYFGVKVLDVRTMNVKGKPKRLGIHAGRRASWKKAIVTLNSEDKIDLFDAV
jgi:large subunit ribosomal protein L23